MVTVLMAGLIHGVFFFWESFIKAMCSGEEWLSSECRSWTGLANKIRMRTEA